MLAELKECFGNIEKDYPFFRSTQVSFVEKHDIFSSVVGWHVEVKLLPPFIQDLDDLCDIVYGLPDNTPSYESSLLYDTTGVYIVYSFNLKDWFDGRE